MLFFTSFLINSLLGCQTIDIPYCENSFNSPLEISYFIPGISNIIAFETFEEEYKFQILFAENYSHLAFSGNFRGLSCSSNSQSCTIPLDKEITFCPTGEIAIDLIANAKDFGHSTSREINFTAIATPTQKEENIYYNMNFSALIESEEIHSKLNLVIGTIDPNKI